MTHGDDSGQPQQNYGQFPLQPQRYWEGRPWRPQQFDDPAHQRRIQSHTKPLPQYLPPQESWAARHKVLTGFLVFCGLSLVIGIATLAGSPSSPTTASSDPVAAPAQTPAATVAANVATANWYPQAIPDSAMPDPNRPASSFSSALAIAAKLGWQSSFAPGSTIVNGSVANVNDQGELLSYPEPGETILEINQGNGIQSDEDIWTFSSSAQEQVFAAGGAQASTDGDPESALLGPGWAIGLDDTYIGGLTYAQGIIGGSLVTWFQGQIHGN